MFDKVAKSLYNINRIFTTFYNIFNIIAGLSLPAIKRSLEKMVRKALLVVVLIVLSFSLIGCQTIQGLGEDIKWIGEKGAEILD